MQASNYLTYLCQIVFVVVQVTERVTNILIPVNVHWFNVQTAALNCLERHAAQEDRHRQDVLVLEVLRVTVVHEEHVHFVLFDFCDFASIPSTTPDNIPRNGN